MRVADAIARVLKDEGVEYLIGCPAGFRGARVAIWRELEQIRHGRPTKQWSKLEKAAEMPIQMPDVATA